MSRCWNKSSACVARACVGTSMPSTCRRCMIFCALSSTGGKRVVHCYRWCLSPARSPGRARSPVCRSRWALTGMSVRSRMLEQTMDGVGRQVRPFLCQEKLVLALRLAASDRCCAAGAPGSHVWSAGRVPGRLCRATWTLAKGSAEISLSRAQVSKKSSARHRLQMRMPL